MSEEARGDYADLDAGDEQRIDGVPVTTPARAIRDAHATHLGPAAGQRSSMAETSFVRTWFMRCPLGHRRCPGSIQCADLR